MNSFVVVFPADAAPTHIMNGAQLISSAAVLIFAYPSEIPATGSCRRLKATIINVCICAAIAVCMGCLTAVITYEYGNDSLFVTFSILWYFAHVDEKMSRLLFSISFAFILQTAREFYYRADSVSVGDVGFSSFQTGHRMSIRISQFVCAHRTVFRNVRFDCSAHDIRMEDIITSNWLRARRQRQPRAGRIHGRQHLCDDFVCVSTGNYDLFCGR